MALDKQMLFIIGAPRSGTTWLQMMLAAHPQVCTTVELTLFSKYTGPWIKTWQREKNNLERNQWHQGLPYIWSEEEFYNFLELFLENIYDKVVSKNPVATHILDKHPGYSMYVNDIHRFFPQARFIHMIRDGRDVALSMQAVEKQLGWFGTNTIAGFAARWSELVKSAQQAKKITDFYIEVKYEELLADGQTKLREIFEFCDLQVSDKQLEIIFRNHQFDKVKAQNKMPIQEVSAPEGHYRQGKVGNWQYDLSSLQKYLFDEAAGGQLYQLGYAKPGWWSESRLQRFLIPLFAIVVTRKNVRYRLKKSLTAFTKNSQSFCTPMALG